MKDVLTVATGAGGFIGGALISDLRNKGFTKIRAVDIKPSTTAHFTIPPADCSCAVDAVGST